MGLLLATRGHTALLDVGHKPLGFTAFWGDKAAFPHSSLVHAYINGSYEIVPCLSFYNTIFSFSVDSY